MSRKNKRYSEEFQLSVIRDYYSSGMSKKACVRKYQLSSDSVLLYWLRKHDSAKESLPLQSESNPVFHRQEFDFRFWFSVPNLGTK